MTPYHDELLQQITRSMPAGAGLEVPPKIFKEMRGRFLDYVPEFSMMCAYPSLEKYATPVGMVQGGILAAAIDNTYGPFAYLLTGRPCITVTMNLAYVRPIKAGEGEMVVEVKLVQSTKSLLFLSARLADSEGRTVCTSTTTMAMMKESGSS